MNDAIKLALLEQGRYIFKAPPVCTYYWQPIDWVRYIDAYKGWRPQLP